MRTTRFEQNGRSDEPAPSTSRRSRRLRHLMGSANRRIWRSSNIMARVCVCRTRQGLYAIHAVGPALGIFDNDHADLRHPDRNSKRHPPILAGRRADPCAINSPTPLPWVRLGRLSRLVSPCVPVFYCSSRSRRRLDGKGLDATRDASRTRRITIP